MGGNQRKFMDISLGFAAGVMLAASYWSLLEPALEMAAGLETYGENGQWAFLPVSLGFFLGAAFVFVADLLMSSTGVSSPLDLLDKKGEIDSESPTPQQHDQVYSLPGEAGLRQRRGFEVGSEVYSIGEQEREAEIKKKDSWRRILLLIVAVTVHNIPEGLAVGVGFGAIGRTKSATFESARNLALGIGIQNFPEGVVGGVFASQSGWLLNRKSHLVWTTFWPCGTHRWPPRS